MSPKQDVPGEAASILRYIRVDPTAPVPLVTQLSQQFAWLIAGGQVREGDRLPPVRDLARDLGIHMHTVRAAYERLAADGLVTVTPGRGTLVQPHDPQRLAAYVSSAPTFTIGVLVPGLNPFYTPFLQGLEAAARESPRLLLVCYAHDDPLLARRYLDQLLVRQVDGLIVAVGVPGLETEAGQPLLPPTIWVDLPDVAGYAVLLDSESAGYLAASHLIEHGHRRIGLISGPLALPNVHNYFQGYERALATAGMVRLAELVAAVPAFDLEAGTQGVEQLLRASPPPTAIVAGADMLAIGAMRALQSRGQRVPEDIAVVGYNDIQWAALVEPPLTTATAPGYQMGVTAMTMLQRLLAGQPVDPARVTLGTELVIRRSCGCPGGPGSHLKYEGYYTAVGGVR